MSNPPPNQTGAPIAVTGLACRMPGAEDSASFWHHLLNGEQQISEIPADRFDWREFYGDPLTEANKTNSKWGGFLDRIDGFDAGFFGISPREAEFMDPQQRVMMELAWHCLEDGGIAPTSLDGSPTGVFIGVCNYDYKELQDQFLARVSGHGQTGTWTTCIPNRISYWFNFHGPSIPIDTACSSSLVAIHQAMQSLRRGECTLALAGGISLICSPRRFIGFGQLGMLSPTGRCHTFDAEADGYVRGEGAGLLLLKTLEQALQDHDPIYGILRGSAINHGGRARTLTAPNAYAQSQVVLDAYLDADVPPDTVSYIECHGTGTPLGDPIEVNGLKRAFSRLRKHFGVPAGEEPHIGLGAIKTHIGHLEASSGIAGLINVLLAMRHRTLPGLQNFRSLNPRIQFKNSPFYLVETARAWTALTDENGRALPRRAGISSFGAGGANAHMVLEEPPPAPVKPEDPVRRPRAVILSARDEATLRALAGRHAEHLLTGPDIHLSDISLTTCTGRSPLPHRLATVVESTAGLAERLAAFSAGESPTGLWTGHADRPSPPPPVFLFTGQGSQYPGMGRGLYKTQPVFREALDACHELLGSRMERPLLDVLYGDANGSLDETACTQPALFAVEYALAQLWQAWEIQPAAVMGHSVGEFVAACVAGVFSLEDGLKLIAARGRLMQALPRIGAMAAVFEEEDAIRARLGPYASEVSIAAINGPGQVVISGLREAVQKLCADLAADGVTTKSLTVSHAFHSPLMEPMLDAFESVAREVTYAAPTLPFVSNVTGALIEADLATPGYWRRHIQATVRFQDGLRALDQAGQSTFLEIGPKPVLISMGRRCLPHDRAAWFTSLKSEGTDPQQMVETAARLYVAGNPIAWREVLRGAGGRRIHLPVYPFRHQHHWITLDDHGAPRFSLSPGKEPPPGVHPLLGRRLHSAGGPGSAGQRLFESVQSVNDSPAYLVDHQVFDTPIFPAAGFIELMMAALPHPVPEGEPESTITLEDVQLLKALVLDQTPRILQTIVTPNEGDSVQIQIYSRVQEEAGGPPATEPEPDWTLHATGRALRQASHRPTPIDRGARLTEAGDVMDRAGFYGQCQARGLTYGPCFQAVNELWPGNDMAVGRIQVPAGAYTEGYHIHPVLLDGCFQVVLGALRGEATATYLPVGITRIRILGPAAADLWSSARIRSAGTAGERTRMGDFQLFDDTGTVVAEVEGLALRQSSKDALLPTAEEPWQEWLYEVDWQKLDEPEPPSRPDFLPPPEEVYAHLVSHRLASWNADLAHQAGGLKTLLEQLSLAYIQNALHDLGWTPQMGEHVELAQLRDHLQVVASQAKPFARLIQILEEAGILTKDGDGWRIERLPPPGSPNELVPSLLAAYPDAEAELGLLRATGPHLADILSGRADPLQLMFPDGDLQAATHLYEDARELRAMNSLVADTVAFAVQQLPADRTLRMLELGAGTGATTSSILPVLPTDRTSYTFTDITPMFTTKAQERFAEYPFLHYQLLDIEQSPESQGFEPHSFDLVLAANVIHATRDLAETVGMIRRLLAPGGMLVLLEGTGRRRWVDLTFGLLEGWWRFADHSLRPGYPLINPQSWKTLLCANGYDAVSTTELPGASDQRIYPQSVITARNGTTSVTASSSRSWLLCVENAGDGDALAGPLRARGDHCVLAKTGERFVSDGQDTYVVDPSSPEQILALLDAVAAGASPPLDGVIHAWSLQIADGEDLGPSDLDAACRRSCGSALALVQALARHENSAPELWLVTRDAVRASATDAVSGLAQSSLWGLAKAIELEHPELRCVRVDLPAGSAAPSLAMLAREVSRDAADREPYVALRSDGRFVGRLVRAPIPGTLGEQERREPPPDPCYQLATGAAGTLQELHWQAMPRPTPGPGDVEILVRAAGLNFIDVMDALGLLPFARDAFGVECAGEVTAVGEGVTGLEPGDAVVGIAEGALARYVTTRAALVVKKPSALSFEEAASIPANFLTADYALDTVAELAAGQSVLVHAASGGTGLAAAQIAQRAGARVLGTASLPKWPFLKAQGVREIMNSRTLEFADQIGELTQGQGVDVVFNSLAGDYIPRSLSVLKDRGMFLEIGKTGVWSPEQAAEVKPDASYRLIDLFAMCRETPETIQRLLQRLMDRFQQGELRPVPHAVFTPAEVLKAFRTMQQGAHVGKLVIAFPDAAGPARPQFRPDATYLIVGGLGGLGPRVASWMMEHGARNFALMGRSGVHEDARVPLEDLQAAGATVRILRADVSDRTQVANALADIRDGMPPLRGVIHSAGVLDDGMLQQQNWERFSRVLAPKVDGAWNLHCLTRQLPLDHFVLFSSVASLLGSTGQGNHSAANAFLDALAAYRRARGLPGLSINWGAWAEIGAAARRESADTLHIEGLGWIAPDLGLQALQGIWATSRPQLGVVPVDWNRYRASTRATPFLSELQQQDARTTPDAHHVLAQLRSSPPHRRPALLTAYVRDQTAHVLGMDSSETIDPKLGFFELGMDSLTSVELRNQLQDGLQCTLSPTFTFNYPTIRELVHFLIGHLSDDAPPSAPDTDQPQAPATREAELKALEEDEIAILLARKLADMD